LVRLSLFILFISKTVTFRVVIDRDEFYSKDIQSKTFFFVKKILFDNILDVKTRERVEYNMNNKYIL